MKRFVNAWGKLNWGRRARAVFVMSAMAPIASPAQTLTTLYSFCSQIGCSDGAGVRAALVQGADGNLYGTNTSGGVYTFARCDEGCGTVFKITPSGNLTTLWGFSSYTDGAYPSGLVLATDGDFYGTTMSGGANGVAAGGYGTVFKITSGGTLTTLYSFCPSPQTNCPYSPNAPIIQAIDGDFYGTTSGSANEHGAVFKMTPGGTLKTLYEFCPNVGCADGSGPSGLIQANDGNFYGVTAGGVNNAGTVFKITPTGTLTTLYSFCAQATCADGDEPNGLIEATDGNFYGTTSTGGINNGGTVFRLTPSGTLAALYSFCSQSGCADGEGPAGLVQSTDGSFYGTTSLGGANTSPDTGSGGTIFRLTPSGTLTTLYSFCSQSGCADGEGPAGLVQATNGDFYGTTNEGGNGVMCPSQFGCGTVYSLSVAPRQSEPTVNAGGVLNSASYTTDGVAPGSIVSIFGTNLAAATAAASAIPLPTALSDVTSLTFNGTPAGLYFVSQNQINAQLPFNIVPSGQGGAVNIVVTRNSAASVPQNVVVTAAAPGIFTTTANGVGQAFAYDNTTGALAAPGGASIGSFATAPISVSSGDALIIACTGLGSVTPSIDNYAAAADGILRYTLLQPAVLIGGVPAQPVYSVLSPQFVSEYQIGVVPSPNTPTGDAVSLQIQIGGVTTTYQATIAVAP